MAKVQNSRAKLCQARGLTSDEPPEHLESEGEHVVKQMVQQQLKTQINLQQELNREQHFTSVTEIIPFTEYVCGETTLEKFEQTAEKVARIEELKSYGLSNEEIKLLFIYESGKLSEACKKIEFSVLSKQINSILKRIQPGTQNKSTVQRTDTRSLKKEIGLCVKPDSEHTKLLNFVLSCHKAKTDPRPPNHPINNLKNLEQDLFGHLTKKTKRTSSKISDTAHTSNVSEPYLIPYKPGESLWDVKGGIRKCSTNELCINKPIYTCKNQTLFTIQNGEIIEANQLVNKRKDEPDSNLKHGDAFVVPDISKSHISLIPFENIKQNRLSVSDIRSILKFSSYSEGSPSRVLFVKNLSRGTTKDDLVSIFGHYDSDKEHRIIYRLMTGRMKGQAFVTFSNLESAQKALKEVNGFIFKGKPIVVQNSRGEINGSVT